VVVPADAVEADRVTRWAASYDEGPVYVRLSRSNFPTILDEDYRFTFGRARVLRDGGDITLMACGLMVSTCLQAADLLAADGIDAQVVNVSTIKPIDRETIAGCAARTGRALTVEEHQIRGGLGSAVCEVLAETHPIPVRRIGVDDEWGQSGPAMALIDYYRLTPERVAAEARGLLAEE